MSESLDDLLEKIEELMEVDLVAAIEAARRLTKQYPDEFFAWTQLAVVLNMANQYDEAITAITRAMEIGPIDPTLYDTRGRYEIHRGNLEAALADFTAGIACCHELQQLRHLKELYFIRADVLVRLKRFEEARADLAHLKDDYSHWTTTRLVTKSELLAACDAP